jgi:dinuclear metal center YbgI/SA1388 family protein
LAATCGTIGELVMAFAPRELVAEWDNVGLLIGDPRAEVNRVLLALDVDQEVVDEALRLGAEMIIAHHPLMMKPVRSLRSDTPEGALLMRLVRERLNVFAAHTNLDAAAGGVSDVLARLLGLENVVHLTAEHGYGRVGDLREPMTFAAFIARLRAALGIQGLRAGGEKGREIRRVAVCGGAGADFWPQALAADADGFVTGDVKYHTARDMLAAGLCFVDAGHYATERVVLEPLRAYLESACRERGLDVVFLVSSCRQEPFTYFAG